MLSPKVKINNRLTIITGLICLNLSAQAIAFSPTLNSNLPQNKAITQTIDKINASTQLINTTRLTNSSASKSIAPAPVFNITTNAQEDLWRYIANQSSWQYQDKSIDQYLKWFENRADYLTRISVRAKWYLHYIVQQIEAQNMPIELALLPIVESAFYPFAYSPEHATGLWQFIPSTGLTYGLTQNWWYDARRDVVASTKAALQYLNNLSILFDGDWLLAVAAYNAGPGRVQREIKKNKKLGKKTDFWHLNLPPETRGYVPKLLAVLQIVRQPHLYKQTLKPILKVPSITKITLHSQLNVKAIAQLSDLPVRLIYELNPGLKRWATPPMANYQLLLPADIATNFTKKLATLPLSEQLEWVRLKRKKDEKFSDIAKAYNIDVSHLETINKVGGFDPRNGDFIIVPLLKQHISFHALNKQEKLDRLKQQRTTKQIIYTVRSGDSLLKIALLNQVSTQDLALWNNISNINHIRVGDKISITQQHEFDPQLAKEGINTRININRKILYQIRKNDTLSVLAKRFGVSVAEIMRWNTLKDHIIKYGENLVLRINIVQ